MSAQHRAVPRGYLTHLVPGPVRHGVVDFGRDLTRQLRAAGEPVELCRRVPDAVGPLHAQFTERLYADTATAAADAFERLPGRVTVTLHDLPTPRDGTGFAERRAAYARVCRRAAAVVVCSEHERSLLAEHVPDARPAEVAVVALPVPQLLPGPSAVAVDAPSVGVFGFLYPGKGHAEIIAAATGLAPDVQVVALGQVSVGHGDLVVELQAAAARSGRRFTVTGHLPAEAVWAGLRAVTVPVIAHRNISASASLNSWLAAGRRPLVPANRYTTEIAGRNPGAVWLYRDDPDGLAEALRAALAAPQDTWIPAGTAVGPTSAQVGAQYATRLRAWHPGGP